MSSEIVTKCRDVEIHVPFFGISRTFFALVILYQFTNVPGQVSTFAISPPLLYVLVFQCRTNAQTNGENVVTYMFRLIYQY